MVITRISTATGLAAALFAALGPGEAFAQGDHWRWSVTPYLWGSDIQADVRFAGGQEVGSDAGFDDILDKLDFAAQLHVETHRGQWGAFADVTYLSLSDDTTHGPIATEAELDTGIYELAGVYTPRGESGTFALFAGARIIDLQLDLVFTGLPGAPVERSQDKRFTDFMVGGRYVHSLSDRWALRIRGDIGAGDTESSWNVLAGVDCRFGTELDKAVSFGWRQMNIEAEQGGRETEVVFSGPIAGISFTF